MAGMSGADVGALASLAAAFGDAASVLARLRAGLAAQMHSVHWEGLDAEAVRDECRTQWEPMLARASELLEQARTDIDRQVRQQLDASDSAGIPGRWPGRELPVNPLPAPGLHELPGAWQDAMPRALDDFQHGWSGATPPEQPWHGPARIMPDVLDEPRIPVLLPDGDAWLDWAGASVETGGSEPA